MQFHCFRYICRILFFITLIVPLSVHAETKQKIVKVLDDPSFNKLWSQYCQDIGERSLLPYLIPSNELKKQGSPPVTFLKTGAFFLVSDNFHKFGLRCYRNQGLRRVIIQKGISYPIIITSSEIAKLPPDRSIYQLATNAYKDFLTSYVDNKVYATLYLTRMKNTPTEKQLPITFIFFINKGVMTAFKYDGFTGIFIYKLSKIKKNTYKSELINTRNVIGDMHLPGNLQFKFTPKGLMVKMKREKKFHFSDYLNNKPFDISPPNDLGAQVLFVPPSNNRERNITALVSILSKEFNLFFGLYATNKLSDPYSSDLRARKKWLLNWIKQTGYLTTESGKKRKIPNIKRLEIWITRYLSKHRIKLIKGKTYYFSRDLSHYMIMDFYKSSGDPIYKTKPETPCLRYKHLDPNVCRY